MGITYFTNLVYDQIRYAVSSGDCAPFVGHNAFLRWNAIQYISYDCEDDNREKWWYVMPQGLESQAYIGTGPNYLFPRTSTCLCASKQPDTLSILLHTLRQMVSCFRKVFLLPYTTNLLVGYAIFSSNCCASLTIQSTGEVCLWLLGTHVSSTQGLASSRSHHTNLPHVPQITYAPCLKVHPDGVYRYLLRHCHGLDRLAGQLLHGRLVPAESRSFLLPELQHLLRHRHRIHLARQCLPRGHALPCRQQAFARWIVGEFQMGSVDDHFHGYVLREVLKWIMPMANVSGGMSMHVSQALLSHLFSIDMRYVVLVTSLPLHNRFQSHC